jgi:hypothetical protein
MSKPTYTPDPRGLVSKYVIHRRNDDGTVGEVIESPAFVLRPYDPHARVALVAYAASVAKDNEHLAADLLELVEQHGSEMSPSQPGRVEGAVGMLIESAREAGAGQMSVVLKTADGKPLNGVFVVMEGEVVERVVNMLEQERLMAEFVKIASE